MFSKLLRRPKHVTTITVCSCPQLVATRRNDEDLEAFLDRCEAERLIYNANCRCFD